MVEEGSILQNGSLDRMLEGKISGTGSDQATEEKKEDAKRQKQN